MCNSSGKHEDGERHRWPGEAFDISGKPRCISKASEHTNLAFFKQVSTSDGNDDDTCGWVAVAEASQLRGGCCTSAILRSVYVFSA